MGIRLLALSLDGSLVPWSGVLRATPTVGGRGRVKEIVERLKKMTSRRGRGLRDDYLLISVGPTPPGCRTWDKDLLVQRAEFKPLGQFAAQQILSAADTPAPRCGRPAWHRAQYGRPGRLVRDNL